MFHRLYHNPLNSQILINFNKFPRTIKGIALTTTTSLLALNLIGTSHITSPFSAYRNLLNNETPNCITSDSRLETMSELQTHREKRRIVYRQITTGSLLGCLAGVLIGKLSRVIFVLCSCSLVTFQWMLSRGFLQWIIPTKQNTLTKTSSKILGAMGMSLEPVTSIQEESSSSSSSQKGYLQQFGSFCATSLKFLTIYPIFKLSFLTSFLLAAVNI